MATTDIAVATPAAGAGARGGTPGVPPGTTLTGSILVVAADAMVLATLLAAWFLIKGGTPAWPPTDVSIDTYMATVYTITAAMSSFAIAWASAALRRHDQRSVGVAVVLTLILGLAQLNLLWYDLTNREFGVADHAFGTLYYLLVGYALVHVALAVLAVAVVGGRALAGQLGLRNADPLRATSVLWHYSTAAWSAIVIAVFVFSPHG